MSGAALSIEGLVPIGAPGEKHYITVEDRELAVEARTAAEAAQAAAALSATSAAAAQTGAASSLSGAVTARTAAEAAQASVTASASTATTAASTATSRASEAATSGAAATTAAGTATTKATESASSASSAAAAAASIAGSVTSAAASATTATTAASTATAASAAAIAVGASTDAQLEAILTDPESDAAIVLAATIATAVGGVSAPVAADAITEWWCHPVATYLAEPYQRTVSGGISTTGKIIASEFNHGLNKTIRVECAQAVVDDHNAPALWAEPRRRMVLAWTNHNGDQALRFKVGSRSGDIRSLATAPEVTVGIGASTSYTQIFKVAHLSDAAQDTLWVFTRRGTYSWAVQPMTINQATGAVTFGTLRIILTTGDRQCYLSVADAHATGDQVLRLGFGYNPDTPSNAVYGFELNCVTGAITSPFDATVAANMSGTNLPIVDTGVTPAIATTDALYDRRFHYVRPGPDSFAFAYAEWPLANVDAAVYKVSEVVPGYTPAGDSFDGLIPGLVDAGWAETPYHASMDLTTGFEFDSFVKLPTTPKAMSLGHRYTGVTTGAFWLRLDTGGNIGAWVRTNLGAISVAYGSAASVAGLWGTVVGFRLRVDVAAKLAYRYWSTDDGATWTQVGTGFSIGASAASLATSTDALYVLSSTASLIGAEGVRRASLKTLAGVVVAAADFQNVVPKRAATYTDTTGKVWSIMGGAIVGRTAPGTPVPATGVITNFGIAGPRVGYSTSSNYIAGMAFQNPSYDRAVFVARRTGSTDTIERFLPNGAGGFAGEVLRSSDTLRLIRPYPPVNGGPVSAILSEVSRYGTTGFTDYAAEIRAV